MPALVGLFSALHKYLLITRRARRLRKERDIKKLPKPLWPKLTRSVSFTLKQDTRSSKIGIKNKTLLILLYLAGLITTVFGALSDNWTTLSIGFSLFFVALIFTTSTSTKILKKRDKLEGKIYSVVNFKMTYTEDEKEEAGGEKELVKVTEWENFLSPRRIEINIPIKFSPEMQEEFARHFNVHLQQISADAEVRTWVADKENGWNYADAVVTMVTVPPLPKKAMWHKGYLNPDYVAWSFFPLGISTEEGVLMPNPENPEEMQSVVGIDISGSQDDMKAKGVFVSEKIKRSPQMLIAGSTGGGKSLAINTLVPVVKKPDSLRRFDP